MRELTELEKKAIKEIQESYEMNYERGNTERCKGYHGAMCILNKHLTGKTGWRIEFDGSLADDLENVFVAKPIPREVPDVETIRDEACEKVCRWRVRAFETHKDPDDAEKWLDENYCSAGCPVMKLKGC